MNRKKYPIIALLFAAWFFACKPAAQTEATKGPDRKFHIINLSLPRTGSGSMWGLFSNYRSSHEFMRNETINTILDFREGKLERKDLDAFLQKRDAAEKLEMDSANFLYLEPAIVVENFPGAKFYLAVRDGRSWVISFLDMMYANFGPQKRAQGMDMRWVERYGKVITPRFDASLFSDKQTFKARVDPLLQDFADFWGKYTFASLQALNKVPANRRLIIFTKELSNSTDRIAAFAGVDKVTLDLGKVHLNPDNRPSEVENLFGAERVNKATQVWQKKIDDYIAENKLMQK